MTPADREHPYGHHKAEYLSAVLEGVLIILAAFSILRAAYFGFLNPKPLETPIEGLVLNGVASLINAGWSFTLIRYGRLNGSPALVADGRHLLTDVLTSVGVLVGVALAVLTRWAFLDPHLVVPSRMSVARAHKICDRIERALKAEMGEAVITIHVLALDHVT